MLNEKVSALENLYDKLGINQTKWIEIFREMYSRSSGPTVSLGLEKEMYADNLFFSSVKDIVTYERELMSDFESYFDKTERLLEEIDFDYHVSLDDIHWNIDELDEIVEAMRHAPILLSLGWNDYDRRLDDLKEGYRERGGQYRDRNEVE
jgi:hypothetical protein